MSRATIKEIAAKAEVSTATVDRALNGRPGVSPANRQRVLTAARDLGYLPSEGMVILPSRPAHLEFLIPFGENAFMHDAIDSLTGFSASLPLVESCRITRMDGIGPAAVVPALEQLSLRTEGVGIIATDHPKNRAALTALCEAGVRVVTLASDIPGIPRSAYVGVDNRIAGRTAARIMGLSDAHSQAEVAVFLGSHAFHGHREREAGFREVIERLFPSLTLLPAVETGEDAAQSRKMTERLLQRHENLRGIYCVGAGRKGIVQALEGRKGQDRPFAVMHDLTETSRTWLEDDLIDVIVDQNARLMGEQAIIQLLGAIAASTPLLPARHIEPRIIFRENLPVAAPE